VQEEYAVTGSLIPRDIVPMVFPVRALSISALALALATLVIACGSSSPSAGADSAATIEAAGADNAATIEVSFDDPTSWETVSGRWMLEDRGDRTTLRQTATNGAFHLVLLRKPALTSVDVSVDFRPISGEVDASGGIVFRALDGANYYVVRANSLEGNFRLYATADGQRQQIATASTAPPKLGTWHTLRVVAVGDHLQAYLDGRLLIDYRDSRFSAGRIGLWTKADAVTEFANLKVTGVAAAGGGGD
jgi:hypothetical protein